MLRFPLLALLLLVACSRTADSSALEFGAPIEGPEGLYPRVVGSSDGALVLATRRTGEGHALERVPLIAERTTLAWEASTQVSSGEDWFVNWADTPALGPDGEFVTWLAKTDAGTYDYGVRLARVGDEGSVRLHDDEGIGEHGFVSLARDGDGLHALWLDGRAMGDGAPMQLRARAVDVDGALGPEALLDERVCECCPTALVTTASGTLVAAYRDRADDETRDIAVVRRAAGASDWSSPYVPHGDGWQVPGCPVNGPALAAHGERVALAWFTQGKDEVPAVHVAFSEDAGASFGPRTTVVEGANQGQLDVAFADESTVLVTWLREDDAPPTGAGPQGAWCARTVTVTGALGEVAELAEVPAARASGRLRLAAVQGGVLAVWSQNDGLAAALATPR